MAPRGDGVKVAVCADSDEYEEASNLVGGRTERLLRVVGGGMESAGGGSGGVGCRKRGSSCGGAL